MTKLKLKINGMHCSSCAMSIDGELEDLGVNSTTSYAKAITEVEFDESKINIDSISKVISDLGYKPEIVN